MSVRSVSPRTIALAAAVACVVCSASAVPGVPGAGQLLQQMPSAGAAMPNVNPGLTIGEPSGVPAPDTAPFAVARIVVSGNTAFDATTLHALVADGEGRALTLAQLYALAHRITDYYRAHGFLVARAYVPAQTVEDGTVRIAVIEARYGRVRLDNRSRVDDDLLEATLARLKADAPVTGADLDRSLLLLGDIPGVVAHATLGPGSEPGTSDLAVDAAGSPAVTGHVGTDSDGDPYTGRWRGSAGVTFNDLLHRADELNIEALTSGRGLQWGQATWNTVVDGAGARAGASYSALHYRLGGPFGELSAHGTADVASAWFMQPFVRSRGLNVSGRLQFDYRDLHDYIDAVPLHNDRHLDSLTASVTADRRDAWLGGGTTSATLALTHGVLAFDDAAAQAVDAATAATQGGFTLWNAQLERLQQLTQTTRLDVSFGYQHVSRNVDSSEEWLLGGPGTVRGYPASALAGASGFLARFEVRHDLVLPLIGAVEGKTFIDSGELTIDQTPWQAGANHARLTGAGIGFDWTAPHGLAASVEVAAPVGATPAGAGPRPSVQVWAQLIKCF